MRSSFHKHITIAPQFINLSYGCISCVELVHSRLKPVASLCTYRLLTNASATVVHFSHNLYATLYPAYTASFPLPTLPIYKSYGRLIPIMHRPNNKYCMDILRINKANLWIGAIT